MFPTGVENMGGGGGALFNIWGEHGRLKMLLKNTSEGVTSNEPADLEIY